MERILTTDEYEYLKRKLLAYLKQLWLLYILRQKVSVPPETVMIAQLIFLFILFI